MARHVVRTERLGISLPQGHVALDRHTAMSVTLGIRPEDVVLGSGEHEALVRVVEPTGHECIILLDVGGVAVTARAAKRRSPASRASRSRSASAGSASMSSNRQSGRRMNTDASVEVERIRLASSSSN